MQRSPSDRRPASAVLATGGRRPYRPPWSVLLRLSLALGLALALLPVTFDAPAHAASHGAAANAAPLAPAGVGEPEASFRRVIRTAYGKLERYAANADSDLRFRFLGFHTYFPEDFEDVRYLDLVTMPEGRLVKVISGGSTHVMPDGSRTESVTFEPKWADSSFDWRLLPEASVMATATLGGALRYIREHGEDLSGVGAATSVEIEVSLYGESRRYRALVLWRGEEEDFGARSFDMVVFDNVTQGVQQAALETTPPEGKTIPAPPREHAVAPRDRATDATGAATVSCESGLVASDYFFRSNQGTNQHLAGNHSAQGAFDFQCTCSGSCSQSCAAQVVNTAVEDYGFTSDACHKMGFHQDSKSATLVNAQSGGARCAAGWKAVQKACAFCGCGISITIGFAGFEVEFGGDTGNWSAQQEWTYTCPPCPLSVDDDGGGGGGGGSDCDPDIPTDKSGRLARRIDTCEGSGSPILVDFRGRGFPLTDVAGGVPFDIDGNGSLEQVAWTEPDSGNAFLALDRDGNGRIDGGHELFGDATEQPASEDPNGYLALATFDVDGDRKITAADPVHRSLLLWEDRNHDGISQPGELERAADRSLAVIELDYKESGRRDRHGNRFRFRSTVYLEEEDGLHRRRSMDVYFLVGR